MMHYKVIKITIDALGLAEIILDVVVNYHNLLYSIFSNRGSLFNSKFWSSLLYFLGINRRLFTSFYPPIDGQIKQQKSIIKNYLFVFVNFE